MFVILIFLLNANISVILRIEASYYAFFDIEIKR